MQDRLKKLFDEIKLEETILEYFDSANIEKVIIYDQNKIIEFLIVQLFPMYTFLNTTESDTLPLTIQPLAIRLFLTFAPGLYLAGAKSSTLV